MVIEQTTLRVRLLSHCIGIVRRQPERGQMHLYAEFDTELVGRIKGSGKLLRFVQHGATALRSLDLRRRRVTSVDRCLRLDDGTFCAIELAAILHQ